MYIFHYSVEFQLKNGSVRKFDGLATLGRLPKNRKEWIQAKEDILTEALGGEDIPDFYCFTSLNELPYKGSPLRHFLRRVFGQY